MVNLVSTVEDRLGSHLLPCTLPLDVQHCQNESGAPKLHFISDPVFSLPRLISYWEVGYTVNYYGGAFEHN
uniref:Uncharacterized protein n=1 Tax=Salix viminalis TaxID=40686 RepID=A0A6N2NAR8_SALVM